MKPLKIFIIGYTKVGKSTLSNILQKKLENDFKCKYISASEYFKQYFPNPPSDPKEHKKYVNEITEFSLKKLQKDPFCNAKYLKKKIKKIKDTDIIILDGIRNPNDFNKLFNIKRDIVIFLKHKDISASTYFEEFGVKAIKKKIIFDYYNYLIPYKNVFNETLNSDDFIKLQIELEELSEKVKKELKRKQDANTL